MELTSMIEILKKYFNNIYPNISFSEAKFPNKNELLFPHLTIAEYDDLVVKKLIKGDGNPLKEINKINSSTTLAIYYYTLFVKSNDSIIRDFDFENQIGIPLNLNKVKQRHPNCILRSANIDVLYGINKTIWFVESKFLEPYYSSTQQLSDLYLDVRNYGDNDNADIWVRYAEEINGHLIDYKFYNVSQMFKHLLAIYSHRKKWYDKGYSTFVLLNVGWKMSESFKARIESRRSLSYINKRDEQIEDQAERGILLLYNLVKELHWNECKIEYKHYNDSELLEIIKDSHHYGDFTKRYLIED